MLLAFWLLPLNTHASHTKIYFFWMQTEIKAPQFHFLIHVVIIINVSPLTPFKNIFVHKIIWTSLMTSVASSQFVPQNHYYRCTFPAASFKGNPSLINPLKPKLVRIIFKNSVRIAKKTQHFTITNINWLTLFKGIIAVYTENHTKHINTKWRVTDW
jgi:hypothetical protein